MTKCKTTIACLLFSLITLPIFAQNKLNWKKIAVLVYTKNGAGYVHANISDAVSCIQKLGSQYGFKVDTSSNRVGTIDYKKAYAAQWDDPVRY
jgi:hypothetical protein